MKITILGERHAGKTHTVLYYALAEAYQGAHVVYQGFNLDAAEHVMEHAVDIAKRLDYKISRISRVNGRHSIHFPLGGHIDFTSTRRLHRAGGRGLPEKYHLLILDDDNTGEVPTHIAHRVVRTICT